jgi:hypothetical protein
MAVPSVTSGQLPQVSGAIRQAAASTGTSFDYLMTAAQLESGLNPNAQAPTSSASGLFQFIDQTWLSMVKAVGPALGFGAYAQSIVQGADGRYQVPDPAARAAIFGMRKDPEASATMAGAFTRSNAAQLASTIGRQPTQSELYMAHFLGADGAGKLISSLTGSPDASAAALFPAAAGANRSIFYDGSRPRSVAEVYGRLDTRFQAARTAALAAGQGSGQPGSAAAVPDTAGVTEVLAAATQARSNVPDSRPLFQAMFSDRASSAIAPAVTSLWSPTGTAASGNTLDLFSDSPRSGWRSLFEG